MHSPKNNQTIDFSYLHHQNNMSNGSNSSNGNNGNNFMKSPRFREKNKEEGKNGKYEEGCNNGNNNNNGYEQSSYEDDKGRDRDRDMRNDKNYRSPRYKAKGNYF